MTVDPARAAASIEHNGVAYYFCGKGCAAKFQADPDRYLKPQPAPVTPALKSLDPVCGMTVDPARAAASIEHNGVAYHFCGKGCAAKFQADPDRYLKPQPAPVTPALKSLDPVCGMTVDPARAAASIEHDGVAYHFCGKGCAAKFQADPDRYLKPQPAPVTPASATLSTALYTCPMHPEVRQAGPGSCPFCGMALEPLEATADESNPELATMTRRFWICLGLTAPILVQMFWLKNVLLEFALATPVVLWAGWPFFERAWASVVSRHLNMFTLIALGTGAAYLYSVVALFRQRRRLF